MCYEEANPLSLQSRKASRDQPREEPYEQCDKRRLREKYPAHSRYAVYAESQAGGVVLVEVFFRQNPHGRHDTIWYRKLQPRTSLWRSRRNTYTTQYVRLN